MTIQCPACGAENPDQFQFCGYCGDSLQVEQVTVPQPEIVRDRSARRSVTSLFVDLTNFTSAAETADPEEIYRIIRNTLEKLALTVKDVGGRVDRYYGDGFLATFGVPEAHEDDQYRALVAALQMQEEMARLQGQVKEELNWEMKLRIGITSGQVVSGQLDTGSKIDSSIFGHAVNLAKRLQSAARPGTILVDNAVYRKTHARFLFRDPIELKLKGIDNPIVTYELIRERVDTGPKRGLLGRRAPLIGRDEEYRSLTRRLEKMHIGHQGMAALVLGEAGIGKSRLVEEVLPGESSGIRVIRSQGSPYGSSNYGFLKDAVRNLVGIDPEEDPEVQKARLRELIVFTGEFGREIEPVLYQLVLKDGEHHAGILNPRQHHQQIIAFIRHLFTQITLRQPLLVLFDDIQWADSSSLEVISHLLELIEEIPLGLIFIARSSFKENLPVFFDSLREDHSRVYLEVDLQPLTPEQCDVLVDALIEETEVPPVLKNRIYERTEGNPLFVEELISIFLERERFAELEEEGDRGKLEELLEKEIPSTVHGLLLNRYDQQPQDLKNVLDFASVLGPRFHLPLLAAVLEISEDRLKEKILQLETAGLLRKSAGLSASLYSFRHALLQEIIYETILFEDRRVMHQKVAQVLERLAGKYLVDDHAVIGYHLERAGAREAADHLLQAGNESAARYANQEAVDYFHRVQRMEESGEVASTRLVDASLGLGKVYRRQGKAELSLEELDRALAISQSMPLTLYRGGDIYYETGLTCYDLREQDLALEAFFKAVEALSGSPESCQSFQRTDVEREIGWVYYRQGELEEARRRGRTALQLAEDEENLGSESSAHSLLAAILFREGKVDWAIQHAENSLLTREHIGDVWRAASSQTTLGHLYHQIGRWEDAEKMLRQAIYVQKEIGDYYTLAGSWTNLGLLLRDKGEYEEALVCMEEAVRILPKHDFSLAMTYTFYINRGSVNISLGNYLKAIEDFDKSLMGAKSEEDTDLSALIKCYLSESHIKLGNFIEANAIIEEVRQNPPTLKEYQAEFFRICSYLFCENEEFDLALNANQTSQKIVTEIANQYELARLLLDEVEIQIAQYRAGKRSLLESEIRNNVIKALEIFHEWGAKKDLEWAEEVLFQVARDELSFGEEGFQIEHTLAAVVDLHLGASLFDDQSHRDQGSVYKLERRLADQLNAWADRKNVYLVRSPSGFKFILNYVKHPISRARLANKAITIGHHAVNTAQRILQSPRTSSGLNTMLKVGISLGESRELIRDADHASMFSSISNLGRRARALAEGPLEHQVLITGEIPPGVFESYELTEIKDLDDRRLPDPVYQVGKALFETGGVQKLPGASPRLVGRDQEFRTLKQGFEGILREGRGHVIYLEAEAGMGKTRLLGEVRDLYHNEVKVLHGKCEAFRSAISYWPLIEMLEGAGFDDSRELDLLESILGLSPLSQSDQTMIDNLPPEDLKKELFSRARAFLLQEAAKEPLMLIFEDVHDLDLSSIELLDYLLPVIYQAPISILLISRSEMPGPHRMLVKKAERVISDRYLSISFSELDREESLELMQAILDIEELPRGLAELMGPFLGHPLSIEEGIRYLIEEGWLLRTDSGWTLIDLTPALQREMPNSFRDVLLRRLNFLDYESLHVVQAGSLLGEMFDQVTLSRVIPRSDLGQRLSLLCDRGWLQTINGSKPLRYTFTNTLVRESVYSTLLRSKKQLLHQRAGEALESLYPDRIEENLELLTHHFSSSGIEEKTLQYAIRAAEKSADRHALEESQRYFRMARDILTGRRQSRSRMMMRVLLGLSDVQIQRGEPGKAIETVNSIYAGQRSISETLYGACLRRLGAAVHLRGDLRRALNIYTKAAHELKGDQELQYSVGGKTVVSAKEEYLETKLGMIKVNFELQNFQETRELAEDILDSLGRTTFSEKAAELNNLLAGISFQEGDLLEAQKQLEQSLAIYQANGNRSGTSSIYANLGVMAANFQKYDQAEHYFSTAVEMYQALGDGNGLATIHNNIGRLALERGQLTQAAFHLEKAAEIARLSELNRHRTQALSNLGYAYFLQGDQTQARTALEESRSLAELYGYQELTAEIQWKLAALDAAQNRLEQARDRLADSLETARETGNQDILAHALLVSARVLRRSGNAPDALERIEEAWDLVKDSSSAPGMSGYAVEFALCLHATGKIQQAQAIASEYAVGEALIVPEDVKEEFSARFLDHSPSGSSP